MKPRRWKPWIIAAGLALALALAVPAAWAIDRAIHDGQVMRNVTLEGRVVGGLEREEVERIVGQLAEDYRLLEVQLRGPDGTVIPFTAEGVGLSVDVDATVESAMAIGRLGNLADRFRAWTDSLADDRDVGLVFRVDEAQALAKITGHPHSIRAEPIEPTWRSVNGKITPFPGTNGARVDAPAAVEGLLAAAANPAVPIVVDFEWETIPTRFTSSDLASALARVEDLVSRPIPVAINGHQTVIAPETVRRWVEADAEMRPHFVEETVLTSLVAHLSHLTAGGGEPKFTVVDGEVQVELPDAVLVCCEGPVADLMFGTAAGLLPKPAELTPVQADPLGPLKKAQSYGIVELVSEFTTAHACCQNRVKNIQRIADIVRGYIIAPGEELSINDFVGQRTREKGFVSAGVIESGRFTDDVGGGISQFATTIFNAAFFAGLDFEEYQSHSIYISRYPYGREATLSFPKPNLRISNPTPYHVLVWTSYTDRTITVQMYSTKYYVVEQTGQDRYSQARCTRVDTYRSRTDPDGNVINDLVFAVYRPGEGLDCNGRSTPRP